MDVLEKSRKLFDVHPPQNNPQTKITQKERHRKFSGAFLFMEIFRSADELHAESERMPSGPIGRTFQPTNSMPYRAAHPGEKGFVENLQDSHPAAESYRTSGDSMLSANKKDRG